MSIETVATELDRALHDRFGLEEFRPGQREVIQSVLDGKDVLCVMPTGGGKSLCYQLPALLIDGVTLVVSPLIALMKDQVDALTQKGLRATLLNSTLDLDEQRARLIEIEAGKYDLVYVAPERFRSGRFVEMMARLKPALLAIDEAHCISEWGHDFRPDYARIGQARRALGMPPCIALTATATDLVRRDIADQLDLRDPAQFVTGFDRPNLSYRVVEARKEADKLVALADALNRSPGPAIIYASSRKRCEEVGRFVQAELHKSCVVYHAGLARDERTEAQERFMGGEVDVVVATNAFGMGVDKADVRSVVHYNMPGTLEAYYQEAGRAGRDGELADCVLLYAFGDRFLQEMFIENEYPPPEAVYKVYEFLRSLDADPIELTQVEIKESSGIDLNESAVGTALKILEHAGALERFRPRENMAIVRIRDEADGASLVGRLSPQAHAQRIVLIGLEGLVNGRFNEPIYFQPDDFSTALGLDRPALTRAIRALSADLPVDYVPPFRGNALRLLDRKRRARDIKIDFSGLDQRKRQEYEKLDRMIRYAQSNDCRRAYILGYFGDERSGGCGRCDNCDGKGDSSASDSAAVAIDTPAGREVIRKALAGVARAKGRFGKTVVAQMLVGSGAKNVDRFGLSKLSTFGILADFTQAEVVQMLDRFVADRLADIAEQDRFRPLINLTEKGWSLLREPGDFEIEIVLPAYLSDKIRRGGLSRVGPKPQPAKGEPEIVEGTREVENGRSKADDPLHQRLWKLRTEWAREANLSPGYVFSNETLELLTQIRPTTPHALAGIKGIGPAKLEKYGSAILEAIAGEATGGRRNFPEVEAAKRVDPDTSRGLMPASHPNPPQRGGRGPEEALVPQGGKAPEKPLPPRGGGWGGGEPERENNGVPSLRSAPTAPIPKPAEHAPAPRTSTFVTTEEWSRRLLERGFSVDEAAAIRGLERSAIIRHLVLSIRQGKGVPLSTLVGPEVIARWDAWGREHGDDPPPNAGDLWEVYLACRKSAGGKDC